MSTWERSWPVPVALVALSAIPLTAGTLRLIQLAGGSAVMPADDRFSGFPAALVMHIVGAAGYALVGAFQFVPRFRRRHLTGTAGPGASSRLPASWSPARRFG